jgi:hypothetical protein
VPSMISNFLLSEETCLPNKCIPLHGYINLINCEARNAERKSREEIIFSILRM